MAEEERDVTITISAKNLTENEFKKVKSGLASVDKSVDKTEKKAGGLQSTFEAFGKAAPGALKAVAVGAAAAATVVGGLATAVFTLGKRGAAVGDVAGAFDTLSLAVGETGGIMLTELAAGVKGTVGNFDLMKVANKALGTGLLTTATDARTLAEGARLLAKRTGTDTVTAFETLTTAMASGRTTQLKQLGLFVDSKKAVEDYAAGLGISVGQMTDVDRAAALQIATMAALRGEIEKFPPPLRDFGELIETGSVSVRNLVDSLAVMISNSPALLSGMQAGGEAITQAFGGDQKELVLGIVNAIERAALTAIEFGLSGLEAAGVLSRGFAGIKGLVLGSAAAFVIANQKAAEFVAVTLELHAAIPGVGRAFKDQALAARAAADSIGGVSASLKAQVVEAGIAAAGNDAFGRSLGTASVALGTIKESMINAGLSQRDLNQATADGVTRTTNLTGAITTLAADLPTLDPLFLNLRGELGEAGIAAATFSEVTADAFRITKEGVEGFETSIIGAAVTAGQKSTEMHAAFAAFGLNTRTELETTVKQLEKDFEAIKDSGEASAKDIKIAWEKLEDARRLASGETKSITITHGAELVATMSGQFAQLGGKFKVFAVAEAMISTLLSVAKTMSQFGFPVGLPFAAGAMAAGLATIAKIKSQGFQEGTPGLDFQNFGVQSIAPLHGMEAVIPQGAGHQLAAEIAGALERRGPSGPSTSTDRLSASIESGFERMDSRLSGLPIAIQRAVRDGIMLSG